MTAVVVCSHSRPDHDYSITEAHTVLHDLHCPDHHCPAQGNAYRVLVVAGEINPDVRLEWLVAS